MRALVFKLLTALGLSILPGGAATLNASWNAPSDIPATAASYSATGNDINLTLNCIPAAAELTVIKNTGLAFIQGAFSNLSQGQAVALTFNAITYNFVANYYGGTGNDLVLVWSGARPFSWGGNRFGQLGDGTTTQRNAPVSVLQSGVLAGKTVFSIASGATHNLALCSDGTLAAWGYNAFGQLGDGTTVRRLTPVAVDQSGVLATKRVVAVAAGNAFSLALCSDGTVAAWGFNYDGELGDGTIFDSDLPVTVDTTTALAGKTVVAISAGDSHALALCSDGTVAAWGYNGEGRLGDDSAMDQWSPVAVATSTALSGKAVVSISAGSAHSLALCSDGTVVSWGTNEFGQVGDGSVIQRSVPVGVVAAQGTSALHGKTVTAIAAGGYHSLALCSDGTVAAWGFNANGQLGDNSAVDRLLPVAVKANAAPSALFGRRPDRVAAGLEHSIAWCSDGTVATWGRNANGQLGDASSIGRKVPVAAATATYAVGERPVLAGSGSSSEHSFSLAASFPAPVPVLAVEYPPGTGIPNGTGVADFGTVPVGGTFSTTFTVRNTGNATLTGFTITKTGANAAEFGVTITPISPLAPGRSSTFPVAITPLAEGPLAANLHIASNDPSNATYTIQLLAAGTITGAVNATFNAATDIPVTAAGYTAAGKEVEFTLNFAPEGGELMVVKNTGPAFISGTFSNLAQGQRVTLGFNGTTWDFVANYYGGSGNDLVLVRVGTRAYAWGYNGSGQLGNGTSTHASVPLPVMASGSGVLRGKTVVALAAGPNHSLALCSDGTVAAWGDNGQGMLGDNTTTASQIPVAVNREEGVSALFGKVVVALAAGSSHSLALCSDGTVAAWGGNSDGQLGDNTTATRTVPMAIDAATAASALLGKTVVGIAAGGSHSMALCSDGTLAAWGYNSYGQLGDNTTEQRRLPVEVNAADGASALFGKTVVAITAGLNHSVALCSDGTVAAWGENSLGQLGDDTTTGRMVPGAVNAVEGVSSLFGRMVVAVQAGDYHTIALCSDGNLAAWGRNDRGQLGDNSTTQRNVPTAVDTAAGVSALSGRTVTNIAAGYDHNLALCSDGTLAAWGNNNYGQLGENSTSDSLVPVAAVPPAVGSARFTRVWSGRSSFHSMALAALPAPHVVLSDPLGTIFQSDTGTFGCPQTPIGASSTAQTLTIRNTGTAPLTGLKVTMAGSHPVDFMASQPGTTVEPGATTTFTVTFAPTGVGARSAVLRIVSDDDFEIPFLINLMGTGESIALAASYTSGAEVPLTIGGFTATGNTVSFALNSTPAVGELMVVKNTGLAFINGTFDNLAQGQAVALSYAGSTYHFVANYYGGSGNDLVLVWAGSRAFAWGTGSSGELGVGNTTGSPSPVPVVETGILLGRTVVAVAAGGSYSLALCSDGTLAAWGDNSYGQLGDDSTIQRTAPVAVDTTVGTSALHGKTVVAIAAGFGHSLALCSDGTVAAWGDNGNGQLGDNTTIASRVPVEVNKTSLNSALLGKNVVAIAAGQSFSLALRSDGTVAEWGASAAGTLPLPTAVDSTAGASALSGKTVTFIAAGLSHRMALCSDGTVATWGYNFDGQIGDDTTTLRYSPVTVNTDLGISALFGKTVVAISAGHSHSMALCLDGTLTAWGRNEYGQLGDGTTLQRRVPVAVSAESGISALFGKTVTGISAGDALSIALFSNGTLAAWGNNQHGQLGDNTFLDSAVPVAVSNPPAAEERFTQVVSGRGSRHTLAIVASSVQPPAPTVTIGAATELTKTSAELHAIVNGHDQDTPVTFDYGTDGIDFPNHVAGLPAIVTGLGDVAVTSLVTGLVKGTTYYYRLTAASRGGITVSSVGTFTTLTEPIATVGAAQIASTTNVEVFGTVNAQGSNTQVVFDYGTDANNLTRSIQASPALATGNADTAVSIVLTNLQQGTTYYYRVRGTNVAGVGASAVGTFQLAALSGISQVFPATPPDSQGFVFVTLQPPQAAGGWRFAGEQQWRVSGIPVGGLATGDREIEFKPVAGFVQPPRETISVTSGEAATIVDRTYYETGAVGSGSVNVTLKPEAIAAETVAAENRAQWRLLGEDDSQWRNSGTSLGGLLPGSYLVECKPVANRTTPPAAGVLVSENQTTLVTITYILADPPVGAAPALVPFETVSTDSTKPYGFVGQIRSNAGSSSGFVVKPRVVATAGHVVFDDGTLSAVTGLQWLHQRHRGTYEPAPKIPRGFYLFDGYAAQRTAENTPGTSSPLSQNLDAASIYFLEDAGRSGYAGYLASDLDENEYLMSSSDKILAGYPVAGIAASNQGRMHATPAMNATFARGYGRTFTTTNIRGMGGMSGGPLFVRHDNGTYYPAAIYLGGSGQTVVRAIDSSVIDLFNRAEVSGNGGDNNTGGGITHSSFTSFGTASQPGALEVTILPVAARNAGATWRLKPDTSFRLSGNQLGGLNAGSYILQLNTVSGFLAPTQQSVAVSGGQLREITFTYEAVNTAPTINNIANQTIDEDQNTGPLAITIGDNESSATSLVISKTSSNASLVPNANIVLSGSGSNRSVTVTPLPNQSGTATITLTVSDGELTDTDSFVVTVNPVNDAPVISSPPAQTINEDGTLSALIFTVSDVDNPANTLVVTRASNNLALVPVSNIILGGTGTTRSVTVTPAANQNGLATITLTVSDGSLTASDAFVLTVAAVNDAPVIDTIADRTINEDSTTGAIAFTVADVDHDPVTLTLERSSSNPTLVPLSGIVFGGSGANRTVTVTPAAGQLGSATITVTVSDGSLIDTDTFTLTVTGNAQQTWRFANFGSGSNIGNGANTADPDGDGQSNIDEFAAGTDPNSAADIFKILTTTRTASTFTVTADGKAARSYVLQRQSTLGGLWEPVTSVGPLGGNATVTLTDPAPPTSSAFYRLSVTGP